VKLSRRQFAAAAAGGAGLILVARPIPATARPALALIDPSLPGARDFARATRTLAIGGERFWASARAGFGLAPGGTVVGLTGWDDWVVLRGLFAERRLRVLDEIRIGERAFAWRVGEGVDPYTARS
jgi:hypothetical protein